MKSEVPGNDAMTANMHFWMGLWQQQLEQSLKVWSMWAQAMPHESARELAAEADAMKAARK